MKIGIYGGSFDPIHKGHIHVALSAINQFQLDELKLVPSFYSPNKSDRVMEETNHRIEMCKIAAAISPKIVVDDYEASKPEISYTYLTMQHYKELYSKDEIFFIMGADSLDYFDKWRHPEIIAECSTILVLQREGFTNEDIEIKIKEIQKSFPATIHIINDSMFHASSTEVKTKLNLNYDVCPEELDETVYAYIKQNHLYER